MTYDQLAPLLHALADVAHRVAPRGNGTIGVCVDHRGASIHLTPDAFALAFDGLPIEERDVGGHAEHSSVIEGVRVFALEPTSTETRTVIATARTVSA